VSTSRREVNRLLALGGAALVVAVPVAIIAASWEPLEPPPRRTRQNVEQDTAPAPEQSIEERAPEQTREPRQRRNRNRAEATPPSSPTTNDDRAKNQQRDS
jgi:hypothetical protein